MGIYDREYYQDEDQPGFQFGGSGRGAAGGRSMVVNLILANVAVFVAMILFGDRLSFFLSLKSDLLSHPWTVWELVTYGFAHATDGPNFIMHIGFNMYGLWLFGRDVEGVYGRAEFLRVYLAMIVSAGLVWCLLAFAFDGAPATLVGASGGVAGVVILYAFNFPHRKFQLLLFPFFPIPAWVLGVLFVAGDAWGALGSGGSNVAYSAHLAGAGFALLYYKSGFRFGSLLGGGGSKVRKAKKGPKLKLHDPEKRMAKLDEAADHVLDKLHRQGESSLTAKERKVLEEYSRRMRQKRN